MADPLFILIAIIFLALCFDFINGMHDTANSIATCVSTRVLSPKAAILMSATLNFVGAFVGTEVAKTIGKGIVDPSIVSFSVIGSALVGAIAWNLITWYFGLPSSSSHGLIGGLIGAVIYSHGTGALKAAGITKVLSALVLSPLIGFGGGFLVMVLIYWLFRSSAPGKVNRWFKILQIGSASFMAFSHGSNDAQKSMGIITMALISAGYLHNSGSEAFHVPTWVIFSCALAMALGTSTGGWKIIKTMGTKMIKLAPVNGFAAEASAAVVILSASHIGVPVSTTHIISSSILGVGSSKRLSAVRWGIVGEMLVAWIFTIPAAGAIAWVISFCIHHV